MTGCRYLPKRILALLLTLILAAVFLTPVYPARAYTRSAADEAMQAFQTHCYNPQTKLYWNNTDHGGVAAIWTHAIFWNMVLDAYERTGDASYLALSNDLYQGGYNQYAGYDWNNQEVWFVFDDLMWWIISMARAYQLTGNTSCRDTAVAGFENVYSRAYDSTNGGMFWGFGPDGMGRGHKNSCINYPTIIAAVELYQITQQARYLTIAQDLYSWSRSNLFNAATGSVPDLISDTGEVDWTNYTYNQGTMIGAAAMLYLETGNTDYLADANLAAQYTKTVMCNSEGILPAEGDWNEQGCMKAIFAHYMGTLVYDCAQTQWISWMHTNANAAWSHRDSERNLMYRDYTVFCSNGMIQSYEASSGAALLQVFAPDEAEVPQALATPAVTVYQDADYGGVSVQLRPGRYTSEALTAAGVPLDWMTSCKVPENCVLQVFESDGFSGNLWEHTTDCANVGNEQNDKMRSCIVYYKNGATFYADDLFRGQCVTLTKGSYTSQQLQALGIPDNWMSSLAVPEGWNVRVYADDAYAGASWNFNRGTHNVGSACNDQMSSVKIF